MNVRDFSLLVKKEYRCKNGARFFTERALLSALLEKHGLDWNAPLISPELVLTKEAEMKVDLEKLLLGYPIQYYLGTEWFCGYEFSVEPEVLIPRPETEGLVEKAAELAKEGSVVLDFCCGSGCIGLSLLLKRRDLFCRMYDLSEAALSLSKKNRQRFSLEERCAIEKMDVLSPCALEEIKKHKPALIVSNPPYLTREEMAGIDANVQSEPAMALYGGEDGLTFYRALISLCDQSGVDLLCEIGCDQREGIRVLLTEGGFSFEFYQDFSGLDRVFYARKIK
ncbi:MAG: peptide chain release factor N(5)-glutamine methyltransferase [Clostridia bacterium]|nr:peptide chain release factor N(5)-glutamine methyltransferase [Clostridia bacterium]